MKSRPKRWAKATSNAQASLDSLREAFDELNSIKEEYQDWMDNLPENLQSGNLANKLQTVLDLDLESCLDEVSRIIDDCDSIDLPLGFGRD